MVAGMFYALFSFCFGLWTRPNPVEAQKKFYVIASFVCFMPVSFYFGYRATDLLGLSAFLFPVLGVAGFALHRPLSNWCRRSMMVADGPVANYFLTRAEKDGVDVKRHFMIKAFEKREQMPSHMPTVDLLISAYNEARAECDLPPVDIDKDKIPYV